MLVEKRKNMTYNAKYASSFKLEMMYGKDIDPNSEIIAMSVLNKDDILCAIKKAYLDMSPRTLENSDFVNEKSEINKDQKEILFEKLAIKFANYMEKGTDDFEKWHNDTCLLFKNEFAKLLTEANKKSINSTYGKAQKIVNMTFKYLYCFDDAYKYIDRFAPCHMALDSYILNWFFSWYKEIWDNIENNKRAKRKLTRSGKYHLPVWSNLEYEAIGDSTIPQYKEIQEAIKTRLGNTSRIEAEFVIWYESKKYQSSKAEKIQYTY